MPLRANQPNAKVLVDKLLSLALEEADRLSVEELVAKVSEKGSPDPANRESRDWAFYYALRYYVTYHEGDAHRAVALLTRFAEVVSRWPIKDREGRLQSQYDRVYTIRWDSNGLWGDWFYYDPERSLPWLWAWDLAGTSAAMRAPGVSGRIEKDLLRFVVERQFVHAPGYGNMDASLLEGIIPFGRILPEPEYIHRVARWANAIMITGFYADGFWHEGTPAYHAQIVGHLKRVFTLLNGYSDPSRFHQHTGRDSLRQPRSFRQILRATQARRRGPPEAGFSRRLDGQLARRLPA
jgi:hypothetical protein